MKVQSVDVQPKKLLSYEAKTAKLMNTDHKPHVVFDAIEQDERAWGMCECVSKRIENLIDCRGTYEERCRLRWKWLGDWNHGVPFPSQPILQAAVRLSGLTWEQYAAKHPRLPYELFRCWEWDKPGTVPIEISREAAWIMRRTNLMIRLIEKSRMKKSKKYRRLSRIVETLHYRPESA